MCGALSGFHALISSGTTPKMVDRESDIRAVGYGGMLLEGFVSIMALVAACALEPGDYFKINIPQDTPVQQARYAAVVEQARLAPQPFDVAPKEFEALQESTGEKNLAGKVGGAVTLAVGMAKVFAGLFGKRLMAYWYHFVIMFEVLFILTLLESGTRVARFVFQEALAQLNPKYAMGKDPNWTVNVVVSVTVCFLWGYLLFTGNIANLWRMMGIANQLLATIALCVGTTYLLEHCAEAGVRAVYGAAAAVCGGHRVYGRYSEHPTVARGVGPAGDDSRPGISAETELPAGWRDAGAVGRGGPGCRSALVCSVGQRSPATGAATDG